MASYGSNSSRKQKEEFLSSVMRLDEVHFDAAFVQLGELLGYSHRYDGQVVKQPRAPLPQLSITK